MPSRNRAPMPQNPTTADVGTTSSTPTAFESNAANQEQLTPGSEETPLLQRLIQKDPSTRGGFTARVLDALGDKRDVDEVLTVERYDDPVTRAEAVVIAQRVAGVEPLADPPARFLDVSASHWAADAIYGGARDGIMVGYGDGTFGPSTALGSNAQVVVDRIVDPSSRKPINWEQLANVVDGVKPDNKSYNPTGRYGEVFAAHEGRLVDGIEVNLGSRAGELEVFKAHYEKHRARYEAVSAKTDIPPALIAALHWRESSGRFDRYLHQGDPIGKPSRNVPKGVLFYNWEDAAVDALLSKRNVRDNIGMDASTSNAAAIATFAEFYNGLGYHNRGRVSPYVYAGTNEYERGKYVADGKYDPNHVDRQLGVLTMMGAVGELDRQLK